MKSRSDIDSRRPPFSRGRSAKALLWALTIVMGVAARSAGGASAVSSAVNARRQDKPNIAKEIEGASEDKERSAAAAPRRPPPLLLDATFVTELPDTDVFLRRGPTQLQKLGRTGADGKLTVKLPRGVHHVTASRAGYRIQSHRINVRPGNTTFIFNVAPPGPPADRADGTAAGPAKEVGSESAASPEAAAEKSLADASGVIRRYLDARETSMVTASDWEMVRVYTSAALKGRPGDASLKAQVLFAEGQIAYLRGDYREALSAFDAAAREAPEMAAPHVGRGNVYLVNNQSAEALKAFRRAAELDPHLALAHRGMGDALTKQGKIKEAAGYHNRAKVLSLTSAALKSARELKKRALWAEALREFQGVAAARQTADLYIDIGDCYVGLGQSADAARAYRRATELDPNAAPAHYKYGEAMYGLDEFAAAAEALERALALDPSGTSIDRARARELADSAAEKARRMN